jgi:hypothetical protein
MQYTDELLRKYGISTGSADTLLVERVDLLLSMQKSYAAHHSLALLVFISNCYYVPDCVHLYSCVGSRMLVCVYQVTVKISK